MKTIAVFQHHPVCSHQSVSGIHASLSSEYRVESFTINDHLPTVLKLCDCVAFPGGIGDADLYYKYFKRRHGNAIADFVASGGKYLGICMGQYWAGSDYFDILDGIDVVQYIKRPDADIKRSFATVADITYDSQIYTDKMFFYDGGTIVTKNNDAKYQVKARYKNGDPMAIIQGNVGIIGCHPESQQFWYSIYPYIKENWHRGEHNKWLLNFVDELWSVN